MFKVMIVDDEPIFRHYIRSKLNWNALGFIVCCEAKHGVEALEMVHQHRPDVALVDINMPFMDGLELAEKLTAAFPEIVVVLVTGHNEFEYARKSIRIGVADYLLKPFNEEEITVTLQKVKSSLQQAQEERTVSRSHSAILREGFLNRLISQEFNMNVDDIEKSLERFRIPIPPRRFRVAVVEIDGLYQRWSDPKEIGLWKHTVANLLKDLLQGAGGHILFHDAEGRTVSLTAFEDVADMRDFGVEAYRRLCQMVERHFKFTATIGIGSEADGYEKIHVSYRDALTAIRNKITAGQRNVIRFDLLPTGQNSLDYVSAEIHESLIVHLRLRDWDGIEKLIGQVFHYMEGNEISVDYAYTVMMGLVSLCLSFAIESGLSVMELFGPDFSPYQAIQSMESIEQSRIWMLELYRTVLESAKKGRLSKSKNWFEAAKEFIDSNFQDPELTVERVAGEVFVDPSYLRKIFRKEGSVSVSDYITRIRMQRAKALLGVGNVKLADIAEKIGYSDANYFSKSFKKYFGMTPSEYESRKK
ncbi:two-component system, response regulator YesN [Paenibacillus sp. yr247]|uniref:response regulator n=1 Tax=Paenibacillus sp. yr247 TaxID=1761880 RepID=UPI0008898781|nr:response regulator [Paenibacillus sp. yr247]SDP03499.1 two-component system, response regulator YesN [Paenibacillus sp. yr247]